MSGRGRPRPRGRGRGAPPPPRHQPPPPLPPPPLRPPPPPPCTLCRQLGVYCNDIDSACYVFGFPQVQNIILNSEPQYRLANAQYLIGEALRNLTASGMGPARIQQPPLSVSRGRGRRCALCTSVEIECGPSCLLAHYFPLSMANEIKDAIRLFGLKHIFEVLLYFQPQFDTAVECILTQTRNLTSLGWPYVHVHGVPFSTHAPQVFGPGRAIGSSSGYGTTGQEMGARHVMGSGRASTELRLGSRSGSSSQEMEARHVLAGSSKDATAGSEQLGTESGQEIESGPGQTGQGVEARRVLEGSSKNATTEFEQLGTRPGQERETVSAQPEPGSDRAGLSKDATTEFEQLGTEPGPEMETRHRSNTGSSSKDDATTEFGSGSSSGSKRGN